MESTFFEDAGTLIRDTMKTCVYAQRVESELLELQTRLKENRVTESDL